MALLMKREFVELEVVDLVGKVIIRVSTTSESFLVCIGLGSYLSKIRKQIQKWVGTYLHTHSNSCFLFTYLINCCNWRLWISCDEHVFNNWAHFRNDFYHRSAKCIDFKNNVGVFFKAFQEIIRNIFDKSAIFRPSDLTRLVCLMCG